MRLEHNHLFLHCQSMLNFSQHTGQQSALAGDDAAEAPLSDTVCSAMQATILTALLQPQPESYDLFDDVLLMAEGSIIYHGPRTEIVAFFESCGFKCPERKAMPDFLQEITSEKDQVPHLSALLGHAYITWHSWTGNAGQCQRCHSMLPTEKTLWLRRARPGFPP